MLKEINVVVSAMGGNMKLNRKGFMMAEVVVVSAVVLITLTTLYMSYNKILSIYEQKLTYEDSNMLYDLAYYRDCLIEMPEFEFRDGNWYPVTTIDNGLLMKLLDKVGPSNKFIDYGSIRDAFSYITLDDYKFDLFPGDNIYLVYNDYNNNGNSLPKTAFSGKKQTLQDYIEYLDTGINLRNTNYIMVLERCNGNDCKYAYLNLEIKDENL